MKATLLTFITTALISVSSGCGGKEENVNLPSTPQPGANVSVTATPATQPAPVAPPPAPGTQPGMPAPTTQPEPEEQIKQTDLEKIMGAVQSYTIQFNSNPASLEELVSKGFLKSIPPAPAGKKWVYDAEKLNVVLAVQ